MNLLKNKKSNSYKELTAGDIKLKHSRVTKPDEFAAMSLLDQIVDNNIDIIRKNLTKEIETRKHKKCNKEI